jgi:TonB family protein
MNSRSHSLGYFLCSSLLLHLLVIGWGTDFLKTPLDVTDKPKLSLKLVSTSSSKSFSLAKVAKVRPALAPSVLLPKNMTQNKSGPEQEFKSEQESIVSDQGEKVSKVKYKYFSDIVHTIHQHKQYPRKAYSLNQEGTVVVRLKLGKEGNIIDLMVLEPCPFKSLNHATLDTITSIEKFPPIPKELGTDEMVFRIPIEYKINF